MHQNAFLFLCIVRLCKGYACVCVCVSPAHPFDCLHFDKQSHFNFRIYFWVWISQLSSAFNARACNAFLLCSSVCACVCVCACVVCLLHFSLCKKLHTIFFVLCFISGTFFRNAFNKIARFTSCIFCAHCRHKKQEKTNEKMHSQLGVILWAFLYVHTHTHIPRCRHRFFRQLSTVFAYVVLILIASHRICMLYTFLIPFPSPPHFVPLSPILSFVNTAIMRVPLWRHLVVCVFEFFAGSHLPNEVAETE